MTLAPLDPDRCPGCGADLDHEQVDQPALVRHGGYGATRRTLTRHCPACGYSLNHLTTETRPPRLSMAHHAITCPRCGRLVGVDEDLHTPHERGCGIEDDGCTCPSVCADCCPDCQEAS